MGDKMSLDRIIDIRKILEPEHVYLAERTIDIKLNDVVNLCDTALALWEEVETRRIEVSEFRHALVGVKADRDALRTEVERLKAWTHTLEKDVEHTKTELYHSRADVDRLKRYEKAWVRMNLLFRAEFPETIKRIVDDCGIPQDEKKGMPSLLDGMGIRDEKKEE
jgi:hypothetical protein